MWGGARLFKKKCRGRRRAPAPRRGVGRARRARGKRQRGGGGGGKVARQVDGRVGEELLALVFFFQAEDGIRDYRVTGVQTCALPICTRLNSSHTIISCDWSSDV